MHPHLKLLLNINSPELMQHFTWEKFTKLIYLTHWDWYFSSDKHCVKVYGITSRTSYGHCNANIQIYKKYSSLWHFFLAWGGGDPSRLHKHRTGRRLLVSKVHLWLHIYSWYVTYFMECKEATFNCNFINKNGISSDDRSLQKTPCVRGICCSKTDIQSSCCVITNRILI
jgi:hypothetical protein